MDLSQLQYFRTIARLENLTKASELLFVAQPNLSVSISRLEQDLGVALFDRRKGRIALTATGKVFLQHVERVLDELESGINHVHELENAIKDQIRVAGSIVDLMADILLQFYPENMDVSIKQVNCPNSEVPRRLLADEVDLGFVYGTPPLSGLEYTFLDSCERGLLVNREHPLSGRGTVSIRDCGGERFICSMARDDDVFLKEMEVLTGFSPRIYFECDALEVETNLVVTGRGVMLVPLTHYLKLMRSNPDLPLAFVRLREKLPEVQVGVLRRRGHILTDASLRFFTHIRTFFKNESVAARDYLDALPEDRPNSVK